MIINKILFPIILLVFFFFQPNSLFSQTIYFGGVINSALTWNVDTVKITGDVFVNDGVTLTVSSATYVESQGNYYLDVKGRLLAMGAINDTIIFSINDTTGFADSSTSFGCWSGILFDQIQTSNDTSIISYCKILYTKSPFFSSVFLK